MVSCNTRVMLRQRTIDRARDEMAAGIRAMPGPKNLSPRIAEYFEPCVRDTPGGVDRIGAQLARTGGNWCAASACFCLAGAARELDVDMPVPYRCSGIELERDAKARGIWIPAGSWRDGNAEVLPGHIAIWDRSTPGDRATSWRRHVEIVLEAKAPSELSTIGGNVNRTWARRLHSHERVRTRLLGFIRIDDDETEAPTVSERAPNIDEHETHEIQSAIDECHTELLCGHDDPPEFPLSDRALLTAIYERQDAIMAAVNEIRSKIA